MNRTIIIGDVHGCYNELLALLRLVSYNSMTDRLIFVGDLINRGPFSLKVLEFVRDSESDVVIGNHELGLLMYIDQQFDDSGFANILLQMGKMAGFWREWLTALPAFIESDDFLVVHAGIVPNQHPSASDARILCNIRTWDGFGHDLNNPGSPPWFELYTNPKLVIFGHWAKNGLVVTDNAIGLDTGCVYGNQLSAVVLPERRVFQVNAERVYYSPVS